MMTARTIKTLGELRQWHLQKADSANAWGKTLEVEGVSALYMKRESKMHIRFAKAIEQCLPRPF